MRPIEVDPTAVAAGRFAAFDEHRQRLGCTISHCRGPGRCVKFLDDVPWRVVAAGADRWADPRAIVDLLAPLWHPKAVLMIGTREPGAVALAESCWTAWGGRIERHPAAWRWFGGSAGLRRNAHMVRLAAWLGPAVVAAWPLKESPDTRSTVELAEAAGVKVVVPRVATQVQSVRIDASRTASRIIF